MNKTVLLRDHKRRTARAPPPHGFGQFFLSNFWSKFCQNFLLKFFLSIFFCQFFFVKFFSGGGGVSVRSGTPPPVVALGVSPKNFFWNPPTRSGTRSVTISGTRSDTGNFFFGDPPARSVGHLVAKFWTTGTPTPHPQPDQWDIWWQNSELQGPPSLWTDKVKT